VIAHIGPVPIEENVSWLLLVASLCLTAALYARGISRLPGTKARQRRIVGAFGALALLFIVFAPPLERVTDSLFSAHMVQHLILLVPVPLLLIYGHVGRALVMGLPLSARRVSLHSRHWLTRTLDQLASVPVVTVFFAIVLWAWHVPALYDAAVANETVHFLEHLSMVLAALLFWGTLTDPRRGFLTRSILVFVTAFHTGLLGAVLVFARSPLYRSHLDQTLVSWSPLFDQQLAGLIMWIPMGGVFLSTLAVIFFHRLNQSEPRVSVDV
jgi:putative membrane protein